MVAVEAPLVDVVRHVEESIVVRRRQRHIVGPLERTREPIMAAGRRIVTPGELPLRSTSTRGFFSFRLGGKTYLQTRFLG
jgi:hypothetical protein